MRYLITTTIHAIIWHRDITNAMAQLQVDTITSSNKLSALLERDESPPEGGQQSIDTLISSPIAPPNTAMTAHQINGMLSAIKTPQSSSRLRPGLEEMHPSKVHQSTSKPFEEYITAPASKLSSPSMEKATPSKSKVTLPGHMSSPGFDFSFTRPESDLSAEAQRIMDSVREEAARIKAQMQAERDKQESKYGEADQLFGVGGRKIAKAKGKSGRFSDAHKQQFKKMDSIANHASTWKNKLQTTTTSLKRSNSKAGLDEPHVESKLPKSTSTKSLRSIGDTGRLENTASGKRVKKRIEDDTSTTRPASRDTDIEKDSVPITPAKTAVPPTNFPSAITTPTKASLARSASVKSMKASMIPSLSRSASTKKLKAPKSEGSNKYLSSLSKFSNMKSILARHQPKFSDDPVKIAAGTHLPMPAAGMNLNKELPILPGAFPSSEQHPSTVKHVEFTPNTKSRHEPTLTPSPSKIPTLTSRDSSPESITRYEPAVEYPSLVNSPNVTHRSPSKLRDTPSAPGDFTFNSARTIDFGPPASGLPSGSTIRPVRPSGFPTPVSVSFGGSDDMPAIPHGMPNKKRKHADSDDDEIENRENKPPATDAQATTDEQKDGPKVKRAKTSENATTTSPQKRIFKTVGGGAGGAGSRIPKPGGARAGKGKGGVLSLSRLNMLARPKERRS